MAYQHQHVWNRDNIGLVPCRHGWLEVVCSVFPVGHCVVGMKCDVVFLDAFSDNKKKKRKSNIYKYTVHICIQILRLNSKASGMPHSLESMVAVRAQHT